MNRQHIPSFEEGAHPTHETYKQGERVEYVGCDDDANSYDRMIGRRGTVIDFWEGDEETNPMVEVAWDNGLDDIDPIERDYFASVNPWLLQRAESE